MWKSKKLFLIFLPLFGLLLSLIPYSTTYAHETETAPHFADEDKQMFVRGYQQNVYYYDKLKNSDIHYFIYSQKSNYSANKSVKVFAYTCDYIDRQDYVSLRTYEDCGTYLTYNKNNGTYEIRVKSTFYMDSVIDYSLKTKTFSRNFVSFQDNQSSFNSFEKILSSTTDPDDYTVYLDTHNKINQFNIRPSSNFSDSSSSNGGGGFNLDFGVFAKGIVNGIGDFFSGLVKTVQDSSKNTADFFSNLPKMLGDFVESLIKIEPSYIQDKTNIFRRKLEDKLGTIGRVFSNIVDFFRVFVFYSRPDLRCKTWMVPVVDNSLPIEFNICGAPPLMIQLARVLLVMGIMSILIHRFLRFFNILLGSKYIWSLSSKKGEDD